VTERMRNGVVRRGSTWSFVVRERDPETGKTKPRWVGGFRTRKDAEKARDGARAAVHRGTYVAPRNLTVGKYLDDWIAGHEVELKPSTAASYRSKIDLYLRPAVGHERLQALSPSLLSLAFQEMAKHGGKDGKPISPRSVQFARAVLRRACNDAVVDRLIEVNPVLGSKAKKVGRPKHVTWTGEQAQMFIEATAGTRLAPLWQLALATGMRRGELMALTWNHLDLDAGIVSIEQSTAQLGTELVTTTPKNDEGREVQIDARTVAVLRAWRKVQAEERLAWGAAYENAERIVFTRENGSRLSPNAVSKAFLRAQSGLGLPRISLHSTRHSHATVLLRAGVPVHIVAKRLGHKKPSITLDVYADAIPKDDAGAADVYSTAVFGAPDAAR
jgi:integrase